MANLNLFINESAVCCEELREILIETIRKTLQYTKTLVLEPFEARVKLVNIVKAK
jgi:hypothetical protein